MDKIIYNAKIRDAINEKIKIVDRSVRYIATNLNINYNTLYDYLVSKKSNSINPYYLIKLCKYLDLTDELLNVD